MSFDTLGLHEALTRSVADAGYDSATEVQAKAIPPALAGQDLMVSSSTGSFSTLCGSGKWTGHQIWWSCEYGPLNHYDLKMKGICNDGGATGCP